MTRISMGVLLLLWLGFVHVTGLYLFTGGFLLTRLALTDVTAPNDTLPPTHSRAIVLIIDALRFDFVSPDTPLPASPYHHNILTLPAQLTAKYPRQSFLFNSYADPPTTTLQRIKGITTGSLPTFVDLGNNFGGSSIAEDSIIKQLTGAGKTCAFMGDDTWMSVFPDSFHPNLTFPYDSFNVEDLHTVDNGVITHLFPLLEDKSEPFDFVVGHFLGVDHVGHRVSPDHPSMKAKLEQMNEVLTRVVDSLDDDTLLVVLGDHGMDSSGDHGGDDILETSSALWIYSKGRPLSSNSPVPSGLVEYTTFPGAAVPHRRIQQIDLVPTLSLLLGLPIPFNNLGSVIPELFASTLPRALSLNSAQIHTYLQTYRNSPSGKELDDGWGNLRLAWDAISSTTTNSEQWLIAHSNFNRVALSECRSMWAQFNPIMMGLGLALLSIGVLASWGLYTRVSQADHRWEDNIAHKLAMAIRGAAAGTTLGVLAFLLLEKYLRPHGIDALDLVLFSAPFFSCVLTLIASPLQLPSSFHEVPFVLAIHAISFLSNSFTFWEDRIAPYLLLTTSLFPAILTGVRAPTSRLRRRILGYSAIFAICVRFMGYYSVCREEQQPYCHVTFYSQSTAPEHIRILILPFVVTVAYAIDKVFLGTSKSNGGMATLWLNFILKPALLLGSLSWILEWVDTTGFWGDDPMVSSVIRATRTWFARIALGFLMLPGAWLWWREPLCIRVQKGEEKQAGKQQVQILGFGNAFGAPYLLFYTIFLIWVWFSSQLTGQVVLGLSTIAFLCYLEIADGVKDVRELDEAFESGRISGLVDGKSHGNADASVASPPPEVAKLRIRFNDMMTISLLGIHTFYATGHQSTISSIQWKSAFVLTPNVTYPFSPLTVLLNSFGALVLVGVAAPLLAVWNREPKPVLVGNPRERTDASEQAGTDKQDPNPTSLSNLAHHETTVAALGVMIYFSVLLLGTAISAAILRRHLMVWKVFAPRFMAAALGVLVVDVSAIVGVGLGLSRVAARVEEVFKGVVG
ncbi:mannose-ethanolamine phosphotransferase gpi13 [Marasmius crinis-equi]|uniref:Mannose-ethanolamine phosphotransferase gpi13 n=1 Tax=Marasmius crinis-equi TaxID=585013 RepID=A0ABR3FLC9_9AGAR